MYYFQIIVTPRPPIPTTEKTSTAIGILYILFNLPFFLQSEYFMLLQPAVKNNASILQMLMKTVRKGLEI